MSQFHSVISQLRSQWWMSQWWMWRTALLAGVVLILVTVSLTAPSASSANQGYPMTPIYRIQGRGPSSPLADRWVDTFGVVTGVTAAGFYLQDPLGDDEIETSDGIFVYTHRAPTVIPGQCVQVQRALVSEFYEKTEISRLTNVSPSALCATTSITPVRIPLPHYGASPHEMYERYEGMLVEFSGFVGVVQGPTKRLNSGQMEIAVTTEAMTPYLPAGRVFQADHAATAALVHLGDGLGVPLPQASWGDRLTLGKTHGDARVVTAVLDYNFGKYQFLLLPDEPISHATRPRVEEQGVAAGLDDFTVCSVNLYGLGRGKNQIASDVLYAAHLRQRALAISQRLHGCTLIGLQELGTPEDGEHLAAELREHFGLPYIATALPGPQSANPDFPLTLGLLTRSDRAQVLSATAPQACTEVDYGVHMAPGECPPGQYALYDRIPLVVDVAVTGEWGEPLRLRVIGNHWKSKAGDERANAVRRTAQANYVARLAQQSLDADPTMGVIVLGDLNDYYGSAPAEALRLGVAPPLIQTHDLMPAVDRYTYIFNGASQVLDHMLISTNLYPMLASVDIIHTNVDFPYPTYIDFTTARHSSDHEFLQIRLRPMGAAILGGSLRHPGLQVTLVDSEGQLLSATLTDALGEFRLWNLRPETVRLKITPVNFLALADQEMTVTLNPGYNYFEMPTVQHQGAMLGGAAAWLNETLALMSMD